MTTQQKNVAIAEMLGYKMEGIYITDWKDHPLLNSFEDTLKFDRNANWQFEALEYIYKKGYDWSIQSGNYCNINNPEGEEIISINIDPKQGSAVFEALYEISKILK